MYVQFTALLLVFSSVVAELHRTALSSSRKCLVHVDRDGTRPFSFQLRNEDIIVRRTALLFASSFLAAGRSF